MFRFCGEYPKVCRNKKTKPIYNTYYGKSVGVSPVTPPQKNSVHRYQNNEKKHMLFRINNIMPVQNR